MNEVVNYDGQGREVEQLHREISHLIKPESPFTWASKGGNLYLVPDGVTPNFSMISFVSFILSVMVGTTVAIVPGLEVFSLYAMMATYPAMYTLRRVRFEYSSVLLKAHFSRNTLPPSSVSVIKHHLNNVKRNHPDSYTALTLDYLQGAEISIGNRAQLYFESPIKTLKNQSNPLTNMTNIAEQLARAGSQIPGFTATNRSVIDDFTRGVKDGWNEIFSEVPKNMINIENRRRLEATQQRSEVATFGSVSDPVPSQMDRLNAELLRTNPEMDRLVKLWGSRGTLNATQIHRLVVCYRNVEESLALLKEAQNANPDSLVTDLPEYKVFKELCDGVKIAVEQIYQEIAEARLSKMKSVNNFIQDKFKGENELTL